MDGRELFDKSQQQLQLAQFSHPFPKRRPSGKREKALAKQIVRNEDKDTFPDDLLNQKLPYHYKEHNLNEIPAVCMRQD